MSQWERRMTERTTTTDLDASRSDRAVVRAGWLAAAGLLGALAASSCCIVPLALFALGVSGAWIGTLTALAPYQPIFIGITLALLLAGYVLVHRRSRSACAPGDACSRPVASWVVTGALWVAATLVAAALAFPYVVRTVLES